MKITHVYVSLDPRNGGPPFVIAGLTQAQQRLGHEVVLLSADPEPDPAVETFLKAQLSPVPPRLGFNLRRPDARALRAMVNALRTADVVHIHGIWAPLSLLAAQACRLLRVPYVVTPHGMLDPWSMEQSARKKRLGLKILGYGSMLRRAAALHLLNRDERDLLRDIPLPKRLAVIPNGIDPTSFATLPAAGTFRRLHPELGAAPYVLFLSRLHRKKGLDLLAEAFGLLAQSHPTVRLVVAGPDEGVQADFEQRIAAQSLSHRVHLTGPLFGDTKMAALRDAAAFVLPSRQEGFSMAITEALASAIPCVISEACHFPEVAEARCGLITTLEPRDITQALATVLSDPTEATAMGARGRALVLDHFTWPAIADQMVALYRECTTP